MAAVYPLKLSILVQNCIAATVLTVMTVTVKLQMCILKHFLILPNKHNISFSKTKLLTCTISSKIPYGVLHSEPQFIFTCYICVCFNCQYLLPYLSQVYYYKHCYLNPSNLQACKELTGQHKSINTAHMMLFFLLQPQISICQFILLTGTTAIMEGD